MPIQIAAVKSALNNTGKLIIQDHINQYILEAGQCSTRKIKYKKSRGEVFDQLYDR
ncbi:metal-sensing transcriptional repressor [Clostridium algidicarnis]|uniref:Metal-sensing transcriptional repressor n=1 Tax=Clostridium algidicarnis TaxID=37659 RepID=A0ABS6C4F5_9CLOT|nr:metal-sensing transcriptional repressor [Clostridium algidicarnis]